LVLYCPKGRAFAGSFDVCRLGTRANAAYVSKCREHFQGRVVVNAENLTLIDMNVTEQLWSIGDMVKVLEDWEKTI
jgi:hypothetical protein